MKNTVNAFIILLFFLTLTYGSSFGRASSLDLIGERTYNGHITDGLTGEQLIGVNVTAVGTGVATSTNQFGYFSISGSSDRLRLKISHLSYQTVDTVVNYTGKSLIINLKPLNNELNTIEINSNTIGNKNKDFGKINVPISQIQQLPRFFGEPDLLKTLQTLPGVQQGSEATSAILVRGGTPDQNLILLDGAPIYNPSHLFGIFSSFNTYAIKNVDLYKGAFPARYGGRLSSVVDISMNDGNMNRFTGQIGIGLLASQITLSGPIFKQKTSFLISARRTYHDIYIAQYVKSNEPGMEKFVMNFYDFNFKLRHKFSDSDQIYLSGYSGEDSFGSRTNSLDFKADERRISSYDLGWQNLTGTLRWNHIFSPRLFSNITLTTSKYRFSTLQEEKVTQQNYDRHQFQKLNSGITDYSAKIDLSYQPVSTHYIRMGANLTAHKFLPGSSYEKSSLNDKNEVLNDNSNYKLRSKELDLYGEDEWQVNEKLKLNAGLHASGFLTSGKNYYSVQPRLSLRYDLKNDWALNASYSNMVQFMHLLSSNSISLPTDLWVPATAKIRPQRSNLYALGILKTLSEKAIDFSVEGYYKKMNNVLEYLDPSNLQSSTTDLKWDEKVSTGKATSYGIEFFLHKKVGKLNGWAGYTIAWANRTFPDINGGKTFPYKYDRRHTLNLIGTYKLAEGIEISSSFIFQTASPFTLGTTQYQGIDLDNTRAFINENIESRNNIRIQPTHRLDVCLNLIKVKKSGTIRTWNFGIYNVYNRKNLFYFGVNGRNDNKLSLEGYSILPILPSVSYNLKF